MSGPVDTRCRKISHPTRDDAIEHQNRLVWTNHLRGQSHRSAWLTVYPCDRCDGWHVGHQQSIPPVWHYTIGAKLDAIVDSGELRPGRRRIVTAKHLRQMSQPERWRAREKWNEP